MSQSDYSSDAVRKHQETIVKALKVRPQFFTTIGKLVNNLFFIVFSCIAISFSIAIISNDSRFSCVGEHTANSGFFTPAPAENFQLRQIRENSKLNGNFKVEALSLFSILTLRMNIVLWL
jgi:uncharacterized protein YhaN